MNHIKALRINKGYSQEGLAAISGVSLRTIQRIENGEAEPRIQTLQSLAKALEVELEQFTTQFIERSSKDEGTARPRWQFALLNSVSYTILPFAALLIVYILKQNRRNKRERDFLSRLVVLDIILVGALTISMLLSFMFKLNGWPGGLEIGVIMYIFTSIINWIVSFVLLAIKS